MDDPKAQTLEALEEFIAAQRSLLARTQEDIERLRALKGDVVRDPEGFFDNLGERLDSPSFRLSDRGDAYNLAFSKKIQWEAFSGHDPTPLQTLPVPPTHPRSPLKTQRTPLSPLQLLVKSAKQSIVDPVFVRFPPPVPLSSITLTGDAGLGALSGLGSLPVNAETARRQREHEKIRELKKMVRLGGKEGGKGRGGGLSLPKQRQQAVFVREDVEDESLVEVDISMDVDDDGGEGDDGSVTPTPGGPPNGRVKTENEWVEPTDVGVYEQALPPSTQKKAKPKPPPAPRTTTRRSTRKDSLVTSAPSLPNTPSTSTASTSRRNKRTKFTHEYTDSEDDNDEYAPAPSTSTSHAPPPLSSSSSTPPPPHQYGGKSVAAMARVTSGKSTPSTSGKSLDAMGLGSTASVSGSSTSTMTTTAAKRGSTTKKCVSGSANVNGKASATGKSRETKAAEGVSGNGKKGKEKVRPETYKQAWSVEEQHLLEQLLEEIPEGSGFRWQKISRAMGGRRTPRQVASRVQKYFEKLKRFGVG